VVERLARQRLRPVRDAGGRRLGVVEAARRLDQRVETAPARPRSDMPERRQADADQSRSRRRQISAAASATAPIVVCAAVPRRNDDGSTGSSPVSVMAPVG
jgi:hypothetical protein